MRKLNRPKIEPDNLQELKKKCSAYDTVKPYIRTELFKISNSKCAYCETKLDREYEQQIEHYQCQDNHKNKVMEWTNLLPACNACNTSKNLNHKRDHCKWNTQKICVVKQVIINPMDDYPQKHLCYSSERMLLRGKDEKGEKTVDSLSLNPKHTILNPSSIDKKNATNFSRLHKLVLSTVSSFVKELDKSIAKNKVDEQTKMDLLKNVDELIEYTSPNGEDSAKFASAIFQHIQYGTIKPKVESTHIFDEINLLTKIDQLENNVKDAAFDPSTRDLIDMFVILLDESIVKNKMDCSTKEQLIEYIDKLIEYTSPNCEKSGKFASAIFQHIKYTDIRPKVESNRIFDEINLLDKINKLDDNMKSVVSVSPPYKNGV
ncbi:MAG: hypothetical protein FWD52_03740 [Candidatus Bathyarchaeota archaeon]|nr:hypothetical protein [Candidatus Termiticorpusculum sp.]